MSRRATVAALAVLAALATTGAPSAMPATADTTATRAVATQAASCVKRTNHLLVNFQIDRSKSLRVTDPADNRVDGIWLSLAGLSSWTDRPAETAPRVEVLLGSFAGTPTPAEPDASDWRPVGPRTTDALLEEARGYTHLDGSRDTDYALALEAARTAIDARAREIAAASGRQPCKAIVFLTDGSYRLRDRPRPTDLPIRLDYAPGVRLDRKGGGARAVAAGKRHLCGPGGLMEGIVDDGIVTFTVALTSPRFTAEQRAFLQGLTTGAGGSCGAESPGRGRYFDVRLRDELVTAFREILGPGCRRPRDCRSGGDSFVGLAGLSGFTLSATAPVSDLGLELVPPTGGARALSADGPERFTVAGTEIRQRWLRDRTTAVDGRFDLDGDAWRGPWRFGFVSPGGASFSAPVRDLRLRSDLRPELVGEPQLGIGVNTIQVVLVDHDGQRATRGELARSARLRVRALDSAGQPHDATASRSPNGAFAVEVDVPDGTPDGDWKLEAEASFAAGGAPVDPELASLSLPVDGGAGVPLWAVLVLLALLALLVLYARRQVKLADALLPPPLELRAFSTGVRVAAGEVVLDTDPSPLSARSFVPLVVPGRDAPKRRIEHDGFELRARAGWRPGAQPRAEATAGGRRLVGGYVQGRSSRPLDDGSAPTVLAIPREVAGTWLLAIDAADTDAVTGQLVVFATGADRERGLQTLAAARAALADRSWSDLDDRPPTDLPEIPDPDSDSGPSGETVPDTWRMPI